MKKTEYRCENCGKHSANYEKRSYVDGVFQSILVCSNCLNEQKKSPRI